MAHNNWEWKRGLQHSISGPSTLRRKKSFENEGFALKTHQMFSAVHTTPQP